MFPRVPARRTNNSQKHHENCNSYPWYVYFSVLSEREENFNPAGPFHFSILRVDPAAGVDSGRIIRLYLGSSERKNTNQPRNNLKFQASLPEADRHDTSAIYRKLTLQELQTIVPQIKWLEYLRSFLDADINEQEPVVAYGLSYFIEMGRILAETDRR
jgi:hypothetical protein